MNILLTSVGRRTYLVHYFQQALGGEGKVYASNSVMTYTMEQADDYVITPQIYDESYIDFLIDYCQKNSIEAIISCFDIDLPVLAANKSRFLSCGIKVIVSSPEVIHICNDKWLTYQKVSDIGLKSPRTWCRLDQAVSEIQNGSLEFPLILKPRWGMGSIGIYKAENEKELIVLYEKLRREIFKTYLRFESKGDVNKCIVIQEMIHAQEYGLDVFNDFEGNLATIVAKRKIAMRAGETDIAEIVDNTPFLNIGKTLSKYLKHIANLDVDCFLDEEGNAYVLELNCRFGGQYPFSHLAGVNFPKQIIEWLKGNETQKEYLMPHIGVKSCKDLNPVIINNRLFLDKES